MLLRGHDFQRQLTVAVHKSNRAKLLVEAKAAGAGGEALLARLQSVVARKAGLLWSTLPLSPDLQLANDAYIAQFRLHFGLTQLPDAEEDECRYCHREDLSLSPNHGLNCPGTTGARIQRHDGFCATAGRCIKRLGFHVQAEVKDLDPGSDLRPDLYIFDGKEWFIADGVIVNTTAPSYQRAAAADSSAVLESAAKKKVEKYEHIAAATRSTVVPFAASVFGGMCKASLQFLSRLVKLSKSKQHGTTDPLVYSTIKRQLCVAIARGNALVLQHAARLERQRG